MYFNVLYHFFMSHRRAIFAKAMIEAARRGGKGAERNEGEADRTRADRVSEGCLYI
jgi:hypothetical protein